MNGNDGLQLEFDCYIVFTRADIKHWLFKFLDKEIQHCYIVREINDQWVIINSDNAHAKITIESTVNYPHIRDLCTNCVILPLSVNIDPHKYRWHLGISSCVDVCKGILGINKWLIFTPYQLYRYLKYEQKSG